jgi:hypothetical protein
VRSREPRNRGWTSESSLQLQLSNATRPQPKPTTTHCEQRGASRRTCGFRAGQTINPFDLEPGQEEPSNDHLAFLKNLTRFMIGDSGEGDTDLLDNLIMNAIRKTYARAQMRIDNPIPLYSDLYDELQNYYDEDKNQLGTLNISSATLGLQGWPNVCLAVVLDYIESIFLVATTPGFSRAFDSSLDRIGMKR